MDMKPIRENIRRIRKEKKLTQAMLAKKCGLSEIFIGSIERGSRNFTLITLVKIANALEVPASEIIPTNKDMLITSITEKFNMLPKEEQKLIIDYIERLIKNS